MHPRTVLVTFLLIYSVNAYRHDERFVSNENMTVFEILGKLASVDDLIIPSIDKNEKGKYKLATMRERGKFNYIKFSLQIISSYSRRKSYNIKSHFCYLAMACLRSAEEIPRSF